MSERRVEFRPRESEAFLVRVSSILDYAPYLDGPIPEEERVDDYQVLQAIARADIADVAQKVDPDQSTAYLYREMLDILTDDGSMLSGLHARGYAIDSRRVESSLSGLAAWLQGRSKVILRQLSKGNAVSVAAEMHPARRMPLYLVGSENPAATTAEPSTPHLSLTPRLRALEPEIAYLAPVIPLRRHGTEGGKEKTDWIARAACHNLDAADLYPITGTMTPEAEATCEVCPVFADCKRYVEKNPNIPGIWALTSEIDRLGRPHPLTVARLRDPTRFIIDLSF